MTLETNLSRSSIGPSPVFTEGEVKSRKSIRSPSPRDKNHRREKRKRAEDTVAEKLYISTLTQIMFTLP